jgi:PKD repeat protein
MATYYAAHNGTVGGTGAIGDPWTLARATAISGYGTLITNGDTVILKDGTYHERLVIRTNGVTFEAANVGEAILDGRYYETLSNKNIYEQPNCNTRSGTNFVVIGQYQKMVSIDANNVTLDGIEIRNVAGDGLGVGGNDNIVRNVLVDFCYSSCIKVRGENSGSPVEDNLIEDCVFTRGAQSYHAKCDFGVGTGCPSVCSTGGQARVATCVQNKYSNNTIFRRCEIAYHNGEGINCGDGAADTIIEYCIVHNNNHGNIYLNTGTNPIIRHNVVFTGQRPEHVENVGDRFQEAIIIRDEPGITVSHGIGQQIYNNIFIGGRNVFSVSSNDKNDTRLEDAYIAHNIFIGIGKNAIQDEITTNVINIEENKHGRPHRTSLIENNIFMHRGTSGIGNLAPDKNVQGVAFRNNLWTRPYGGSSTPPAQYQGDDDIYTATPKLVNAIEPTDQGVINGVSSYSINTANYGPATASPAIDASSDGSAINGATLVNVTTDFNDAARTATKTNRDIGAIEFGGAVVTPGVVTAAFSFLAGPTGSGPLLVTVDESSSTTAGTLTRWIYNWGDGDIQEFAAAANRSHIYDDAGNYTFKLTVENSNGISDSDTGAVVVSANTAAPLVVDVRIDTLPTDTSTLDVVFSLGGQKPKAALFFLTSATATNTDTSPAMLSVGMYGKYNGTNAPETADPFNGSVANVWRLNDAAARDGTAGWSYSENWRMSSVLSSAGVPVGEAGVDSTSGNTITLIPFDAFPSAYKLVSVGFAGADLRAVRRFVLFDDGAGETRQMVTPFTPDLVFVCTTFTGDSTGRPVVNLARFSFGMAARSPAQAWAMAWGDNVRLTANRVAQYSQTAFSSVSVESWNSDGVTFRRHGAASTVKSIDVLAMFTGGRAAVSSILTPDSTTPQDYALSADPGFMMALMTQLSVTGVSNGIPGGSAGIYVTDGTDDYSIGWRSVSALDPTDTGSRIDDKLRLADQSDVTIMEGSTALGTEEWTATMTTASATKRLWPVLTISESTAPTGPIADFSADMTTAQAGEEITFTDQSDDGGDTIEQWIWDYGDGESEIFTVATNPTHEYEEAGFYTVSLYITTDVGGEDTETKVSYIHIIAPQSDTGEIYGPFDPESTTNYSDNHVGRILYGDRPAKMSHKLDLDALWIDEGGPTDGWVPLPNEYKIKIGHDPDTSKLRLIRSDGAQATIDLEWSVPPDPDPDPDPDPGGTVVRYVTSSNNDGSQDGAGAITLVANTVVLTANAHWGLTRFEDMAIPKSATITSALLEVYVPNTTFDDINMAIYAEDAVNSLAITSDTNDISARSRTTANVSWVAASVGAGWQTSPDLSTVVSEVISRDDWVSGSAFSLIYDPTASSNMHFRQYDYREDMAAKLTVVYET